MDDRPVDERRLEVIDSGDGERMFSAMRQQSQRGHDFQRRFRWMWLRHDLVIPRQDEPVIDVRRPELVMPSEALPAPRLEGSGSARYPTSVPPTTP
jgi:hypothetical protein